MVDTKWKIQAKGKALVQEKVLHRPTSLFPKDNWKELVQTCKKVKVNSSRLRKVYLDTCEFKGFNKGGVVLEKWIKGICHLETLKLDRLASCLFPVYEVVEVVDCIYIGLRSNKMISNTHETMLKMRSMKRTMTGLDEPKELKSLLVRGYQWPPGNFSVSDGFSKDQRENGEDLFSIGDKILIRHNGIKDEVREQVLFLGHAVPEADDASLQGTVQDLATKDARYGKLLERTREKAQDVLEKAQEDIDKTKYAISFLKFMHHLIGFTFMKYEDLIKFACDRFTSQHGNWESYMETVLRPCVSIEDYQYLLQLVRIRYDSDTRGFESNRFLGLLCQYPVLLMPFVMIQRAFRRRLLGPLYDKGEMGGLQQAPKSWADAWLQTSRQVLKCVLREHYKQERKRPSSSKNLGVRGQRSAPRGTFSALRGTTRNILEANKRRFSTVMRLLPEEPQQMLPGKKAHKAAECRGCFHVTFLQPSSFCASCDQLAKSLLADLGGYQFLQKTMFKASGLTTLTANPPSDPIYFEEYDRAAGKSFYYDVVSGDSRWQNPRDSNNITYLTKDQLRAAKRGKRPEWQIRK